MSIPVVCPSCAAKFAAPDEAAGKNADCLKCGGPIVVPVPRRPLATQKQKDYARELGIEFPADVDRKTISKLIDEAVVQRDGERFRRLDELERREALAAESLRLADATADEMVKALYDRGMTALLITMPTDKIVDFDSLVGITVSYSFTDNMTMENVKAVILAAASMVINNRFK